jgi:hypothetical protein
MTTIYVKGQDVRVGDDLWWMGTPHRVTRIERYVHPVVTRNEEWRTAYSDTPQRAYKAAWAITLEYDHGHAAGYEITLVPGDDRTDGHSRVDPDDYLDPFLSTAEKLWARYQEEGMPGLWRDWAAALPPEDLPGPHPSGLACFTGVRPDEEP